MRPRIVLADDQPELRSLLAMRLRRLNYLVLEAGDGTELFELLGERGETNLIICDLDMPLLSGLEALIKLRTDAWTTPFILMTGFANQETHDQVLKMGGALIFPKPLDLRNLVVTTQALVGL